MPAQSTGILQLFVDDLGCWKDTAIRAIPILEGQEADLLTGAYNTRNDPVRQCAMAAIRRGYTTFALQNGGQCMSSPIAQATYKMFGKSTTCPDDGEGGPWANNVSTQCFLFHSINFFVFSKEDVRNSVHFGMCSLHL